MTDLYLNKVLKEVRMNDFEIAHYRLLNQGIATATFEQPVQAVAWLGAMQAQDYPGTLWALALRTKNATEATIEQAIADRTIVRTWPQRGTLHFVAAADIRWMLKLLTPRIVAGCGARHRQLELDEATFSRSKTLIIAALEGGQQLTRPQIYEVLEQGNISTSGQRAIHILWHLAQDGLICFGSHRDKQPSFVLLDEWLPSTKTLTRDEALAELARRYFTSHGPATLQDFGWWSGLKISEARAGLEMVKSHFVQVEAKGQTYWLSPATSSLPVSPSAVYLLPGFDEYLLGYKDRSAVLAPEHSQKIVPGNNGMFMPTIISAGRVVGTWKRSIKKATAKIVLIPFATLSAVERQALEISASRYGQFLNMAVYASA